MKQLGCPDFGESGHGHRSARSLRPGVHRMAKAPSLLTKEALGPRDSQYTSLGCMGRLGRSGFRVRCMAKAPSLLTKGALGSER
ncbi:hypothetical protein DPMN_155610 [Dreissena polymorpha]|uniref:Uncharacterized protein n=1 Tax=Dreissena polymorpha TaxID=45954 RepID=A0A9D4FSW6_DREPO|nr:hypothetical protein DPMN_155610 [Dreissena polymorpha]